MSKGTEVDNNGIVILVSFNMTQYNFIEVNDYVSPTNKPVRIA